MAGGGDGFEAAVFTGARRTGYRTRWLFLVSLLLLEGLLWWVMRDVVYTRLLYRLAQTHFHYLASASVEPPTTPIPGAARAAPPRPPRTAAPAAPTTTAKSGFGRFD